MCVKKQNKTVNKICLHQNHSFGHNLCIQFDRLIEPVGMQLTVRHIKHNTTNATTSSANNNAFIKTRTLECLSKGAPSDILEFILVSQTNVCTSHHLYSHLW